jgi:hypothetical protein
MKIKKILIGLFLILLIAVPIVVSAYTIPSDYAPPSAPFVSLPATTKGEGTVILIVNIITGALLGIAASFAIFFLAIGGFRYVTSLGQTEVMEKAKKTIIYAILGLLAVIFSYIIVQTVIKIVISVEEEPMPTTGNTAIEVAPSTTTAPAK